MKAELKALANESFQEQFEHMKRRGLIIDQHNFPFPAQNELSGYKMEIERLRETIDELRKDNNNNAEIPSSTSSRKFSAHGPRADETLDFTTKRAHSPRIRSPSSEINDILNDRNGMFVIGPASPQGSNQRVSLENNSEDPATTWEKAAANKELQELFAPPQNLDESDYTILRVFNPVKYSSQPKQMTAEEVERQLVNKLKVDQAIYKHRHRMELSKLLKQARPAIARSKGQSPRGNHRLHLEPSVYQDEETNGHNLERSQDSQENESDVLRIINPVLDHFAPPLTDSSGPNQVIYVRPASPQKKTYEETIYLVESRPASGSDGRLSRLSTPFKASYDKQSMAQPQTLKVSDMTIDQFQLMTDKLVASSSSSSISSHTPPPPSSLLPPPQSSLFLCLQDEGRHQETSPRHRSTRAHREREELPLFATDKRGLRAELVGEDRTTHRSEVRRN